MPYTEIFVPNDLKRSLSRKNTHNENETKFKNNLILPDSIQTSYTVSQQGCSKATLMIIKLAVSDEITRVTVMADNEKTIVIKRLSVRAIIETRPASSNQCFQFPLRYTKTGGDSTHSGQLAS